MRKGLLIFICLLKLSLGLSQDNQFRGQVVPPSPEVSALARFSDVKVSKSHGLPGISVPVYSISQDDFDLPIALVYHGGGIKVEELAGWVGLGWALNSGGTISRTLKGIPDESSGARAGYINHMVDPANLSVNDLVINYNKANNREIDFEQDIFNYNFGNYAGKFVLNKAGQAVFLESSNLKVSFSVSSGHIASWTVVDPLGNTYLFIERERTIVEALVPSRNSISYQIYDSSWHLSKITTYKGSEIFFDYTSYQNEFYRRSTQSASYFDQGIPGSGACGNDRLTNEFILQTTLGKQISKIRFDQGEVNFTGTSDRQDSPLKRLTGISVKNKQNKIIKSFTLQHGYYNSTLSSSFINLPSLVANSTPTKRLRLASITETTVVPNLIHSFSYEGNDLPHLFSNSQDHWGFYNGITNQSLIPQYMRYRRANSNRLANPNFAKYGVLNKITFPTGGSVTYVMEGNSAMVSLKDYNDYFAPVHQESNQPMYSATVSHSATSSQLTVQPKIYEFDSLKRFTYTISFPSQLNCDSNDRDCIGSIEVSLSAIGTNHYMNLLSGPIVNGQIHGAVSLKAGVTYNLRLMGRSIDIQGMSAAVRGYQNPPIVSETGQISVNIGGLRVKEILKNHSPNIEKIEYKYENRDNNNSSGVLATFPKYDFFHINMSQTIGLGGEVYNDYCSKFELRSVSQLPVGTSGSFFGYSNVREIQTVNNETHRADFGFYTSNEYSDVINYSFPFGIVRSNENRRGAPKDEIYYTHQGTVYKKSRESIYLYGHTVKSEFPNYSMGCLGLGPEGCIFVKYLKYFNVGSWNFLSKVEEINYDYSGSQEFRVVKQYLYNLDYFLPVEDWTIYNSGKEIRKQYYYSFNMPQSGLTSGEIQAIGDLNLKNRISNPLLVKTLNSSLVIEEQKYIYSRINGLARLLRLERRTNDPAFFKELEILSYDTKGNLSSQVRRGNPKEAFLWLYDRSYLAAVAVNADVGQIAFTSFETNEQGGWTYSGTPVTTGKTGKNGYNLSSGSVTKTGITASSSTPYRVGFWAKTVSGTASVNVGGQTESLTTVWKWVEKSIIATSLTISGSNIIIDELRLHPADAMMTSYTYEPLVGMTSKTDPRGYTVTYYYDTVNRLQTIKDEDGNILEHYEYNYSTGN